MSMTAQQPVMQKSLPTLMPSIHLGWGPTSTLGTIRNMDSQRHGSEPRLPSGQMRRERLGRPGGWAVLALRWIGRRSTALSDIGTGWFSGSRRGDTAYCAPWLSGSTASFPRATPTHEQSVSAWVRRPASVRALKRQATTSLGLTSIPASPRSWTRPIHTCRTWSGCLTDWRPQAGSDPRVMRTRRASCDAILVCADPS